MAFGQVLTLVLVGAIFVLGVLGFLVTKNLTCLTITGMGVSLIGIGYMTSRMR